MPQASQVFTTIKTEGLLLPPELIGRVANLDPKLPGTRAEDYNLPKGERINEATNRSWNRLTALWTRFRKELEGRHEGDAATGLTRDRWLLPLFEELGYGRLQRHAPFDIDGKSYAISHLWGHAPIHLIGAGLDLDKRTPGQAGTAQSSPHGLAQQFLNRTDDHLWAFISNGLKLRILRDNLSLIRQAYVEFDLAAMMDGELYSDFRLLWLLCHQSRVEGERPAECWLEKWSQEAREQGARALEHLREGVEKAISALGSGFLAHPGNQSLHERLAAGTLDSQDYYRQILRIVYRLVFLFVAEDRDLLLVGENPIARQRYIDFYSTVRLRRIASRLKGGAHDDLYESIKLIMHWLFDQGCPELALPILGSFLWDPANLEDLGTARIRNRDLLEAVRHLAFVQQNRTLRPVDYRNLGSEELGSVYEALLELHPKIHRESATFKLTVAAGSERKTSGSYYTSDELVQCLLDTAIDPVVARAIQGKSSFDAAQAILQLKVCDTAVGSGHFLVGVAHRLAYHLARVRRLEQDESEPSIPRYQQALRDVIGRCLYGVDINPMAAELCRVNLWLESLEPGKPLSFLDHHIRVGNSLFGTTPALIAAGLPDDAFKSIEGDDKKACTLLKKRNKAERERKSGDLFTLDDPALLAQLQQSAAALNALPDTIPEHIRSKEVAFRRHEQTETYLKKKQLADTWCAAFVVQKSFREAGNDKSAIGITQKYLSELALGQALPSDLAAEVQRLSAQYQFFHWYLAFPEVFAAGGFDCVLGNPPWERVKLQEQEFFAARSKPIATARNAAARKKLIAALPFTEPALWDDWQAASRTAQGNSHFARHSGRFPLCGKGDIHTYALFAEHNWQVLGPNGRAGFIVPSGIATDDTTKDYFKAIMQSGALRSMWEFENEGFFTAGKGHMLRFALTTLSGGNDSATDADFMFQGQALADLDDPERHFTLSAEDIATINPNTGTCPIFRTKRDASIALTIYRKAGVLWRENHPDGNPWGLRFLRMFDMANDLGLFRTQDELTAAGWTLEGNRFLQGSAVMLPLYEAKMAYIYNHRNGTFENAPAGERPHRLPTPNDKQLADPHYTPLPFYWVAENDVEEKLEDVWDREWLLGWRDVTDARASIRTVVASVLPRSAVNDKFLLMLPSTNPSASAALYANLCSFAFDYCARQKVGGISLKYFTMRQLPTLTPSAYKEMAKWEQNTTINDWILQRALELTYTSFDLKPFALDCGESGPPYHWNPERRFFLQCELDAAFFHLYGIPPEDVDYILDTFPVLMRNDMRVYGEFRTKLVILEIYDALARAISSGEPYQSALPPAQRGH